MTYDKENDFNDVDSSIDTCMRRSSSIKVKTAGSWCMFITLADKGIRRKLVNGDQLSSVKSQCLDERIM